LYQKKTYYNFCLSQDAVIKDLKIFALKKLTKYKKNLYNIKKKKDVELLRLKKEISFFYYLVKNHVWLNLYSSKFDSFLKIFLSNLLNASRKSKKPGKIFNFLPMHFRNHNFLGNKLLSGRKLSFSFYAAWFQNFILHGQKFLVPEVTKVFLRNAELKTIDFKISELDTVYKKKPESVLYFGKFTRFFHERFIDLYFNLFK
jgi:hypothetical protein